MHHLLFSLLLALPLLAADSSWQVRTWVTDDGLPNNDVTCLDQGADGAMLLATRGGLARFDGLRFRDVEIEVPGTGSGVNAVLAARDGSQWMVTRGVLVHRVAGEADRIFEMPALEVPGSRETAFFEDPSGVIWLGYEGGRFHRLIHDKLEQVPVADGLSPTFASGAAVDGDGRVWACGPRVLARWQGSHFEAVAELPKDRSIISRARDGGMWIGSGRKLMRYTEAAGLSEVGELTEAASGSRITSMLEDRSGRLWLGTFGAGLWLRTSTGFQSIPLPNADVWWLGEDREGSVWAATGGGGVSRVRPRVLTLLDEPGSPRGEVARALCVDARGDLWVTLQNGAKLMVRRRGQWLDLAPGKDWPAKKATRVNTGPSGNVWIGTGDGDLVRWDGQAFETLPLPADKMLLSIVALFESRDGDVWVGRGFNVWRRHQGEWRDVPMPDGSGEAQTFAQDASGQLWAGSARGMLLREENGRFVREAADALGPPCSSIRSLLPMADGSLLIATHGAGIARLAKGQCHTFARDQGLPHNNVSQLARDTQNRIWAGCDAGLFMVPYEQIVALAEGKAESLHAISFGRSEGISGLQANASFPGSLIEPDGTFWCSTRSGLARIETSKVGQNNVPPQPSIEVMTVNDIAAIPLWQTISGSDQNDTGQVVTVTQIKLNPGVQTLAFEFGASSYIAPESVRLRYQLSGIDKAPRIANADRRAVYGRIPPGSYTLSVSAANNDGLWSTRDTILSLSVQPFYYETAWFRILCVITAIVLLIVIVYRIARARYRRRTEALRREAAVQAERTRIARDMHDQIGASLTQISLLSDIALAQGSDLPQIPRLAETARQAVSALDEIVWAVDPAQDRFDSLLEYLAPQITDLAQAANLRCRLDFPPQGLQRHLPAAFRHQLFLIIREAVNNTIKHAHASELKVSIHPSAGHLHIEIADNGTGFTSDTPRGNGLNNMRTRTESLGGTFHLERINGTRITVIFPWPKS